MTAAETTLVDLLGETRARIVELLRARRRSVAELAEELGVTEVAVRRHLQVLERDDLVGAETIRREGPGRPGSQYHLTARAERLFPARYAELADELMTFLEAEHGRGALREFLRWRMARQADRYAGALPDTGSTADRVRTLAALLDADGFMADAIELDASPQLPVLELRQSHCAIKDVAEAHPEICAYEAALFRDLLGAKVSRRETIAGGATQCVCTIVPDERAGA